ncbi:MAG: galactonate dehydratase [Candidatus Bathyarchaeota archaeon]|nr:MAG: galactonate dehydratase [Candidatus Bathyarchaeota archaeon]
MKITNLESFLIHVSSKYIERNWHIVKLDTDEGLSGVGEVTLDEKGKTVEAALREVKRYILGKDPFQIERHWQAMYGTWWRKGPVLMSALSGVEQALWDIVGKKLETPIYNLLGGAYRDKIKVYANMQSSQIPEELAEEAKSHVAKGITAVKFFYRGKRLRSRELMPLLQALRDAVGEKVDIALDFTGRYRPDEVLRVAKELEEFGLLFLEEPISFENIDALAKLTAAVRIPIATGERLLSKFEFRELLEKRAADIIQPDPCNSGGILECRKVAAMAEAHYIPVALHNPYSPVGTAVCVQLDTCIPNSTLQEYKEDDIPLRAEFLKEPIRAKNGFIPVPTKPGLGIELNEDLLAELREKHPYEAPEWGSY